MQIGNTFMVKPNRVAASVFFLLAIIIAGCADGQNSDAVQPIVYSHYTHVEEGGAECLDCHQYAETQSAASIPNIKVCIDCHDEAISESEDEATLLMYISENKKIPWRQVYSVPDYVFFSHRRHVKLGQMECAVCHGDVGSLAVPVAEQYERITMEWCMDCHETSNVSNDCYACHR